MVFLEFTSLFSTKSLISLIFYHPYISSSKAFFSRLTATILLLSSKVVMVGKFFSIRGSVSSAPTTTPQTSAPSSPILIPTRSKDSDTEYSKSIDSEIRTDVRERIIPSRRVQNICCVGAGYVGKYSICLLKISLTIMQFLVETANTSFIFPI